MTLIRYSVNPPIQAPYSLNTLLMLQAIFPVRSLHFIFCPRVICWHNIRNRYVCTMKLIVLSPIISSSTVTENNSHIQRSKTTGNLTEHFQRLYSGWYCMKWQNQRQDFIYRFIVPITQWLFKRDWTPYDNNCTRKINISECIHTDLEIDGTD